MFFRAGSVGFNDLGILLNYNDEISEESEGKKISSSGSSIHSL